MVTLTSSSDFSEERPKKAQFTPQILSKPSQPHPREKTIELSTQNNE